MARNIDVQEIRDMNDDEGFFTKVKGSLKKPMVHLMAASAIIMSLGIQDANAIDLQELDHYEKMEEIYKACNYDGNGNAYVSDLTNPTLKSMIKEKCEEAYDYKNSEQAHSIGFELEMNAIDELNSGFTIEQQMAMMLVSSQFGGNPNNIHEGVSRFNDYHAELVNNGEFKGSKNELLDFIIEDNGLTYNHMSHVLPDEVTLEIGSFLTHSSKLEGEERSLVVKNGMDIAKMKGMTDVSEEKAIKLSQNNFLERINRDGGIWDDRIDDMSTDPVYLSNAYNSAIGYDVEVRYANSMEMEFNEAEFNADPDKYMEKRNSFDEYETRINNEFDNYANDANKAFDDFAKQKSAAFDDFSKETRSLDVKQETRSLDVKTSVRKLNY